MHCGFSSPLGLRAITQPSPQTRIRRRKSSRSPRCELLSGRQAQFVWKMAMSSVMPSMGKQACVWLTSQRRQTVWPPRQKQPACHCALQKTESRFPLALGGEPSWDRLQTAAHQTCKCFGPWREQSGLPLHRAQEPRPKVPMRVRG